MLESYCHVATIISTPCDIIRNTHGWTQPGAARDHHNNVCINVEMFNIPSLRMIVRYSSWNTLFEKLGSLCFQAAELHALNKIVEQQK